MDSQRLVHTPKFEILKSSLHESQALLEIVVDLSPFRL